MAKGCLTDVQISFHGPEGSIAPLVSTLSGPDAPLKDCKLLDEALLTLPNPRIQVLVDNGHYYSHRTAGGLRAGLQFSIIEHAFPTMNKRGLLTFDLMPCKLG